MKRSDVTLPGQAAVQCFLYFPLSRSAVQAGLSTARGEANRFIRLKCYGNSLTEFEEYR